MYKIKDKEKSGEKSWFVATNAKLENTNLDKNKFEKVLLNDTLEHALAEAELTVEEFLTVK